MVDHFISYRGAKAGQPNAHGLVIGEKRLLLDCGAGLKPEDVERPDWIWVSHAHGDHCRGMLALLKRWPDVSVLATEETRRLLPLALSKGRQPSSQVEAICRRVEPLPWGQYRRLSDDGGLQVMVLRAGHCPGAAMLMVEKTEGQRCQGRVLYTGDFCTHNQQVVEGAGAPVVSDGRGVDMLIMESMLATDEEADGLYWEREARRLVEMVEGANGPVLMGAMAIGEAQEVAALIADTSSRRVLVDSYMEPHFEALGLDGRYRFGDRRQMRGRLRGGGVVICSGARFQSGTTSAYLARELVTDERATIAVLNRCRKGTGAGRLLTTERGELIQWEGRQVELKAEVQRYRLINHAPRWQLLGMIDGVGATTTHLVHGSTGARWALKRACEAQEVSGEVVVTDRGETYALYSSGC